MRLDWHQVVTVYGTRTFSTGLLWEIGRGVAIVIAERPLVVGEPFTFALPLPDGDVAVEGEVVWSRASWSGPSKPPAMGVGFRAIDADGQERLECFLEEHGLMTLARAA